LILYDFERVSPFNLFKCLLFILLGILCKTGETKLEK
jgi:hypothetical protein